MPDQFIYDSCSPDMEHDAGRVRDHSRGDFVHRHGGADNMSSFDVNF